MKNKDVIKKYNDFLNENVDKTQYVKFISQQNGESYNDVFDKFNDVKFITLYRSEGIVVDKEKLPKAVKGNSGRWFTPQYNEVLRYQKMNKNRKIYKIDVPLGFYNALRDSLQSKIDMSIGEVVLPQGLSELKTEI